MCIAGEIEKTTVGKSVIAWRYFTLGRSGLLRAYFRPYKYAPPKQGKRPVYKTLDDPTLGPDLGFHAHASRDGARRMFRVRLHGTIVHHTEYGRPENKRGYRATGMTILGIVLPASACRKTHRAERLAARRYHIKIERAIKS